MTEKQDKRHKEVISGEYDQAEGIANPSPAPENQDQEKSESQLNDEIISFVIENSVLKGNNIELPIKSNTFRECMSKARQQGRIEAQLELSKLDKKTGAVIKCSRESKCLLVKQGAIAERKKIIDMLENEHLGRQDILDQLKNEGKGENE
jgi:hypothetical protein